MASAARRLRTHRAERAQADALAQLGPFELRGIGQRRARRLYHQHFASDRLEVGAEVPPRKPVK